MNAVLRWALLISFTSCFLLACSGGAGTDAGTVEQNNVASFAGDLNNELGVEGSGVGPTDGDIVGSSDGPVDEGIEGSGTGPIEGQIELGPVIKALVEVFDTEDLTNPILKTTTIDSTDLKLAGTFTIPEGLIKKDKLYLVKGTGGLDIDIDDDGILNGDDTDVDGNGIEDTEDDEDKDGIANRGDGDYSGGIKGPLPVQGVTRLLITGEQMLNLKWNASALTEYVFAALQYSEINSIAINDVLETMDEMAPILLDQDINGDGKLDAIDLIVWEPNSSDYKFTSFSAEQMREFITLVHEGKNTTKSEIPKYKRLISHTDTKSSAERVIVQNDIAFVATPGVLLFYDVSDTEKPILKGRYFTGPIRDFVVIGAKLFYTNERGLSILDLSDLKHPTLIDAIALDAIKLTSSNDRVILITSETDDEGSTKNYLKFISITDYREMASEQLPEQFPGFYARNTEISAAGDSIYIWRDYGHSKYQDIFPLELLVYSVDDSQSIELINTHSIFTQSPFLPVDTWGGIGLKDTFRNYWYNKILIYDNIVSFMTPLLNNEKELTKNAPQLLETNKIIEIDKEPYDGYNIFKAHGDHLFVLSDQHTYSVYDMSDLTSPKYLTSLDICVEHTALRFTEKFIMTKCRDEFRFWDVKTLEYLGSKSVSAFNIRPGILLDPSNGLNWLETIYHVGAHFFIDQRVMSNADDKVIPNIPDFIRGLDLIDLAKSYMNWKKWGIMMTHDFDLSGNTVFLATGSHGLQILNFDDIELSENIEPPEIIELPEKLRASISLGQIQSKDGSVVANNGFIGNAVVDISSLNAANTVLCTSISSAVLDDTAGTVLLPKDCLVDEKFYLVTASMGQNLDPDNNGTFGESPRTIEGKLHGIFTGTEILSGKWQVNLYTEYLYQKIKDRLDAGIDSQLVMSDLAHEAKLIEDKVNLLDSAREYIYVNDETGLSEFVREFQTDQTHFYSYGLNIKRILASDDRLYLVVDDNYIYVSDKKTHKILNSIQLPHTISEIYLYNGSLYALYIPGSAAYFGWLDVSSSQITQIGIDNDNLTISQSLEIQEKVFKIVESNELGLLAVTHSNYIQIQPPGYDRLNIAKSYAAKSSALENAINSYSNSDLLITVTEGLIPNVSLDGEGDTSSFLQSPSTTFGVSISQEHNADFDKMLEWRNSGLSWQEIDKSPFAKYGHDISDPAITYSVNDLVISSMNYYFGNYYFPQDIEATKRLSYLASASKCNIYIQSAANVANNLSQPISISKPGEAIDSVSISDKKLVLRVVTWEGAYFEVYQLDELNNPQLQARFNSFSPVDGTENKPLKKFGHLQFIDNKVYGIQSDKLYAFDLTKSEIAEELWHIELEGLGTRTMTIDDDKAYLATTNKGLIEVIFNPQK